MPEKKWLIIYLAPNYLRKAMVVFDSKAETAIKITEEVILELYPSDCMYGSQTRLISKRDQCQIVDSVRDWIKNAERQNSLLAPDKKIQLEFIASESFKDSYGAASILASIKSQTGFEPSVYTSLEEARQSFLGLKKDLSSYRPNSRLIHLNIGKDKIVLVFGDLARQDKILQIDFGIQQITEFMNSLKKTNQIEYLAIFIKANLYRFIEQANYFGKPQLVSFDENTARLLIKALNEPSIPRVNADWIQQLCIKILDSDFRYLNNVSWLCPESKDYTLAHLILVSFLLEGLGASPCVLYTDNFFKGHIIDQLVDQGKLHEQYAGHRYDWQRSAQEILIRLSPHDFNRATQLSILSNKIFDSTYGGLHSWTKKDKRILSLGAFFSGLLSQMSMEAGLQTLLELQGVSYLDCQIIICIIALSSMTNLSGQSKYLDCLPPEERSLARKMAAIVQMAKALDVTGRSVIHNIQLETKEAESYSPLPSSKLVLKVFPRFDPAPELIQANILKKNFENQFEKKVEIQISGEYASSL